MAEEVNVFWQLADHSLGNYTVINNEICQTKDADGNGIIPLEARGLFLTLLTLSDNWVLNEKGLAKICGCGREKIHAALKILIDYGYIIRSKDRLRDSKGHLSNYAYIICETINSEYWIRKEPMSDFPTQAFPTLEFPLNTHPMYDKPTQVQPTLGRPTQVNPTIYNNTSNKVNTYKVLNEENIAETSFRMENSPDNFINNNHDTCEHDSCLLTNVSITSKKHDKKNVNMENSDLTNLNNSENQELKRVSASPKPKKKKLSGKKGKDANGNIIKNQLLTEEAQQKSSLADVMKEQQGIIAGEQTEEDKSIANVTRIANVKIAEIEEKTRKLETAFAKQKNRESLAQRIYKQIDIEFSDVELGMKFKSLVAAIVEKGVGVTQESYNQLKRQLMELGETKAERMQMLEDAIAHNRPKLYSLTVKQKEFLNGKNNGSTQLYKPNEIKKTEIKKDESKSEDDAYLDDYARDENGNLIEF